MDTKTIVILANSNRVGARCIVGKDIETNKWIRPVSNQNRGISEQESRYKNDSSMPKLLDIVKIPVKKHKPTEHQKENYIIDKGFWKKIGEYNKNKLDLLLDSPEKLWDISYSSTYGINDRIEEKICNKYTNSVYLIKPASLKIKVDKEFNNLQRKVRAEFQYNNKKYILSVTDPLLKEKYLKEDNGSFDLPVKNIYLCVSLAMPYKKDRCCYKLLASLIEA